MPTATLTSKGQITIPSEVRKDLRLFSGSKIDFHKNERGEYVLHPKRGSIMDLEGILSKMGYGRSGPAPAIEEMDQAITDGLVEKNNEALSDEAKALLGISGSGSR